MSMVTLLMDTTGDQFGLREPDSLSFDETCGSENPLHPHRNRDPLRIHPRLAVARGIPGHREGDALRVVTNLRVPDEGDPARALHLQIVA